MNRQQIYKDMESTLGVVPSFFKAIPDSSLELEWQLFKKNEIEEGPIPDKYRNLINLAASAAIKCPYCILHCTEMSKVSGASEAEIENAIHLAKSVAGWSTYLHGIQVDMNQFKREVQQACEHVRSMQAVGA